MSGDPAAPGDINAIFTKALIPFIEREAGPAGVAGIVRLAGRPREWLVAEYNWLPLPLADGLVRLAMALGGESDEDRWARRFAEYFMDWKPSREERAYLGTYTMALGSPRGVYERIASLYPMLSRLSTVDLVALRRNRATVRLTPRPDVRRPRWVCTWLRICFERFPTNWGLPRATIAETQCAAAGAPSCLWEISWKNPALGARFWAPTGAGAAVALAVAGTALAGSAPTVQTLALTLWPALGGAAAGAALLKAHRHRQAQRLLDLQGEEILHSSRELETKFRDLETKIEQLSLLIDLGAAVNATLDPVKIYDQALHRLVHRMGYRSAHFFTVDLARRVMRRYRVVVNDPTLTTLPAIEEFPLDPTIGVVGKVAVTGMALLVNDVDTTEEPVNRAAVDTFGSRAVLAVPLQVKRQTRGVIALTSREAGRFSDVDVELVSAVANHVALALERAESFQTIEELSRGLEDKVRLRTEQLRAANEELQDKNRRLTEALERQTATAEILRVMATSPTDVQPVFDAIAASATRLCDGMFSVVFRFDGALITLAAHHAFSPEALAAIQRGYPTRPGRSTIAATAILERRIVHIRDAQSGGDYPHPERARAIGYRSILSVPMMRGEAAIGAINVARHEPIPFSEPHIALLQTFADQAAIAIENVRLFTELQAAYRNLQAAQVQLVQREKMASVGQLVAGVAHELNNPIGFVFSNISTLEDFVRRLRAMVETYRGLDVAPADRERVEARWNELKVDYALRYVDSMIQGIREGAERTRKIVGDLRVFARTPDDVWQTVDLHEELESSLTLLGHLLKDRVTVHRKFGALPSVECIRSQIDQVFLNLLANAAQAIAGPGTITIETRAEDGVAVIEVTDTGPGIPPEVIHRIFDPFFTTKPVGDGTGLGLSISYEIVKKHGGQITVASLPGGGATFTVRIPVARRG